MAVKFELPLTQNSTIVAFLCALLVAIAITFEFELEGQSLSAIFIRLAHLGTFSTWLGVQVWVTFFAGKSMLSCNLIAGIFLFVCFFRHHHVSSPPTSHLWFHPGKTLPQILHVGDCAFLCDLAHLCHSEPLHDMEMAAENAGWRHNKEAKHRLYKFECPECYIISSEGSPRF